ncbi:hypothetical protein HanXRQr2_Chr17g0805691 [Helianthus annuus]|uniref:Uncharacterized protein n=1 Tax=Helianthus annuus TaxID=4232 RepID=A0A251RS73_HELAN|nr:hypothetical protein HanXRQr2_Chr17g0805691 [Helianthus annuus]KAJ0636534.1 hypothetical protein HanOQP8_Chr17g0663001 [Helianthus annuus]KAJ0823796.1 hypothetical protein HanLR1_Chr00c0196g0727621 [Helianthus annuus]
MYTLLCKWAILLNFELVWWSQFSRLKHTQSLFTIITLHLPHTPTIALLSFFVTCRESSTLIPFVATSPPAPPKPSPPLIELMILGLLFSSGWNPSRSFHNYYGVF